MDRDLTEPEIEAIVADAIAAEASSARREAQPPSGAIVWWRAQMRARQEATRAVERPLTIVHTLAIACAVGLLVTVVGAGLTAVKSSLGAAAATAATVDLSSRWITLPMTAMLVSAVIVSVAALVIYADE